MKSLEGICHICGKFRKLSFEHIPPHSAFNDSGVVLHAIKDIITKLPDELKKGKIFQGGIGRYTLCEQCNNNTGRWYGEAFSSFSHQGMNILHLTDKTPSLHYNFLIYPLRILKQLFCMFFSTNGEGFQSKHQNLVKFVLNKNENYLESDVRIYLFYNTSGTIRQTGVVSRFNLQGEAKLFSEITFPPFGYVMNFDNKTIDKRLTDITYFKSYKYNEWASIFLKLPVLPVYTQIPGDYRGEEEVKKTIEENRAKL